MHVAAGYDCRFVVRSEGVQFSLAMRVFIAVFSLEDGNDEFLRSVSNHLLDSRRHTTEDKILRFLPLSFSY
jgi:hypothetical protein